MDRDRSLDITVIGVSARFPGCSDVGEWWSALQAGRVLTKRYAPEELLGVGVPKDLIDDPDYVPVHGHLSKADRFDNALFQCSPRDAEMMDPQHRLMLETAWAALEDAAVPPRNPGVTTGVFASASGSGYMRAMLTRGPLDPVTLEQAIHGTEPDFMASLISYKLGLTGPSLAVQAACSSSLVGVHLAVQSLLNGECDQAVVVAAGIPFPQAGYLHIPGGIHSPSGRCRPFDADADGVVAGSGVAAVVLRRLQDGLDDGPEPYGIILGTAINNDGATKAGYYAPSASGQETVIRTAMHTADVEARSVGYLETHGTGTRIGDPIEWAAASAALRGMGAIPGQVAVGALKANTGHLDNAAGVASLIKALFVVKEGVIPPVAGFTRMNPLLETEESPLSVPTEARFWDGPLPRRAGISSFGVGGTNVHVIVEEAPRPSVVRRDTGRPARLLVLSAAGAGALSRSAARLGDRLAAGDELDLTDVSFTLAGGRAALPERLAVAGRTGAEIVARLASGTGVVRGRRPADGPAPIVFLFPGQGVQYPGMARPFIEALPGFSSALEHCLEAFDRSDTELGTRLRRALLDEASPAAELDATELAQPALFTVEYAAATALSAFGVTASALAGHSLGEITAACVARVLDLPDAARFVAVRGRAMESCPPGAMLVLRCEESEAQELVAGSGIGLELAAINAPDACVVAGTTDAVEAFESWLGGRILTRRLRTRRAFHSALIEPALPLLTEALRELTLREPVSPLAANESGRVIAPGDQIKPEMFVAQARRTVRFADGMGAIAERFPNAVTVEVGPGRMLSAMAAAADLRTVPLCPAGSGGTAEEVLAALGELWILGQPIDPAALCGDGRRVHLPSYPFSGPAWTAPEIGRPATGSEGTDAGTGTAAEPGVPDGTPAADPSGTMARLWSELLGRSDLTADSDFFELGGDSLLITSLARRIDQEVGVRVPLRAMLAGRTLGRQTEVVRRLLERS